MTHQLSPAAQAVLAAYRSTHLSINNLAAALRALNKFVHMDQPLGDSDADAGVFTAHQAIHGYIECIATELESLPS